MRMLYFQCAMGASGDMLTAALASLLPDPANFANEINALGLSKISARIERASSLGMTGWHARICVDGFEEDEQSKIHSCEHVHHHAHASLSDILLKIDALPVSPGIKAHAKAVYARIAEAEAFAHGVAPGEIHFHEVGAADAICDIVAVCILMEKISPSRVICSPICVGSGLVYCAHGFLPVPAPATAKLLEGIPAYGSRYQGELCTPTGAALLAHFADEFGAMPSMRIQAQGCGIGARSFPEPNCLRVLLGESTNLDQEYETKDGETDAVREISANIDDMTAEDLALARDLMLEAGALDAWISPIMMKKGRMGSMLTALCHADKEAAIKQIFFQHTTTLGVRAHSCERNLLKRSFEKITTPAGEFRLKKADGWGVNREKPEFDDIAAAVRSTRLPASQIRSALLKSAR